MDPAKQLIAIVGPTASGKSSMALRLAKRFSGEIVCGDSRTIYRGMDKGTAKPSLDERAEIQHHCLDLIDPDQKFSVVQFKREADNAIAEIQSRGNVPFLVGGSGLYIDAVLYDYQFSDRKDIPGLESMELGELGLFAANKGLTPSDQLLKNKRHLMGYILRNGESSKSDLIKGALVLGVKTDSEVLKSNIRSRIDKMVNEGMVEEVKGLLKKWGRNAPGFMTPGYQPMIAYLENKMSLEDAIDMFVRNDNQLARRQMTWFKRNKDIHWITTINEAEQIIQEKLLSFGTI